MCLVAVQIGLGGIGSGWMGVSGVGGTGSGRVGSDRVGCGCGFPLDVFILAVLDVQDHLL